MTKITDVKIAKSVLTTAKEFNVWETPIPLNEDRILEDANYVYEQAETAWNNNMRGKAVSAVKFAIEVDGKPVLPEVDDILDEEPERLDVSKHTAAELKAEITNLIVDGELAEVENIREAEENGKARKGVLSYIELQLKDAYKEPDENGELESGDRGEDKGSGVVSPWVNTYPTDDEIEQKLDRVNELNKSKFDESFEAEAFAQAQARKLNLPIPGRVDDIPNPTLERGVASLTIAELGEKLNDASLCLAAATWQTAIAEIDVEHAKRVANHYFNKEFPKAQKDAKNKDAAVAVVEEVEKVKEWRQREFEAESRHTTYRSLKEIYSGTHGTISRIFAMKQEERERG